MKMEWDFSGNYYELFGVSVDADTETIKKGYKREFMLCHSDKVVTLMNKFPDKSEKEVAEWAHERSKLLNHVLGVLEDPQKRGRYDRKIGLNTEENSGAYSESYNSYSSGGGERQTGARSAGNSTATATYGDIKVNSSQSFSGNVIVDNLKVNGHMTVAGNLHVKGNLKVNGMLNVGGDLRVDGNRKINGMLNVAGNDTGGNANSAKKSGKKSFHFKSFVNSSKGSKVYVSEDGDIYMAGGSIHINDQDITENFEFD